MLRERVRTGAAALRCTPFRFAVCCAATSLLSLWIRSGVPATALALAGEDDALFVRLARSLAGGHWLGPFDDLTLVKGMAYPLFIAASFWAGIPLKLAEQGAYLAACLLAAGVVRRVVPGGSWAPAAIFVVLALDPVLWTAELARIVREGLYISLSLALVVLSARVSLVPVRTRLATVGVGALLGGIGGTFWLTREEGVWLLPALALNVGLGALAAWRARDRRAATRAGATWASAALVFLVGVCAVAGINRARYGAFETTEVQSLPFRRAYGELARIRQTAPRRYVVLPKEARDAAYAASPAARELAPVLDGPLGDARRRAGCIEAETTDCPEILAGWFQWALRDAVAAAGHYGSAAAAAAYYDRLADEIDDACRRGALACLPQRATLVPPFRWDDVALAARTFPRLAGIMTSMGSGIVGSSPSVGSPPALAAVADLVGPIAPPLFAPTIIRGWAAAADRPPDLRLGSPDAPAALSTGPAPDVSRVYPTLKAVRFTIETAGSDTDGDLVVETSGGEHVARPLASLVPGAPFEAGGVTIRVDDRVISSAAGERRREFVMRIAARIADLYANLVPVGCMLACLGLVAAFAWRRSAKSPPVIVAVTLSCAVAVLCRLVLLAYVDATAIPSVNGLYPSPASPLLLLFAASGCWLGAIAAVARARDRRSGRNTGGATDPRAKTMEGCDAG